MVDARRPDLTGPEFTPGTYIVRLYEDGFRLDRVDDGCVWSSEADALVRVPGLRAIVKFIADLDDIDHKRLHVLLDQEGI